MPDTLGYLILGLIVTFTVLGGFIFTMIARWRALQRDLKLMETLKHDD